MFKRKGFHTVDDSSFVNISKSDGEISSDENVHVSADRSFEFFPEYQITKGMQHPSFQMPKPTDRSLSYNFSGTLHPSSIFSRSLKKRLKIHNHEQEEKRRREEEGEEEREEAKKTQIILKEEESRSFVGGCAGGGINPPTNQKKSRHHKHKFLFSDLSPSEQSTFSELYKDIFQARKEKEDVIDEKKRKEREVDEKEKERKRKDTLEAKKTQIILKEEESRSFVGGCAGGGINPPTNQKKSRHHKHKFLFSDLSPSEQSTFSELYKDIFQARKEKEDVIDEKKRKEREVDEKEKEREKVFHLRLVILFSEGHCRESLKEE
ncbi:hypothetical protein ADUPG1_013671 [Aduncisulcus paluster]|uniref:Uncharacterized protein n=1 Tax=Aduncisulcus paluster TaxID=2918883 RepID=A0ABQ5K5K4_9EUKA|nr:hypothetical protein ADUPG1_013671 [Aduncisulcus paluster]